MIRCDSVLRETLRINAYRARNMMRKVMVNNLKTEDGIVLPKGSDISSSPSPFKLTASCSMTPSSSILSAILAFVNQVRPTLPTSKRNPMTIKARLRISALFPRVLNICRLVMASTLVLEDTSLISSSRWHWHTLCWTMRLSSPRNMRVRDLMWRGRARSWYHPRTPPLVFVDALMLRMMVEFFSFREENWCGMLCYQWSVKSNAK